MGKWQVATLHPPHLAAICVCEGAADFYRDALRHGGIYSDLWANWFETQVRRVQHGWGERGNRDPNSGFLVAGPETLPHDELERSRVDFAAEALERGVTFETAPFELETEFTGPVAARLFLASSTTDADLFLTLQLFDPEGREVTFPGAVEPRAPIAQGWLRASHRRLDPVLSVPWRPYHTHDRQEPLTPGEVYELDVEIWPTSIVVPAGYRLALRAQGKDFERSDDRVGHLRTVAHPMRGSGPFTHTNLKDRPPEVFHNRHTLYGGGGRASYLLLPVIP